MHFIVGWYLGAYPNYMIQIKVINSVFVSTSTFSILITKSKPLTISIHENTELIKVKIDLEALANWAGTDFICGEVVGMTLPSPHETLKKHKLVHVKVSDESNCNGSVSTKDVPFDVISIDIGSTTRDFNTVPGASKFCISTRPISALVRRIEIEESLLQENFIR